MQQIFPLFSVLMMLSLFTRSQTGCIKGDCVNGYGTKVFENGEKYEGTWKDGQMHGWGKYYYRGNDVYEGQFHEHMEHGLGIYKWYDGYFYAGQFEMGYSTGYGIEFDDMGGVSKFGKWQDNRLVDDLGWEYDYSYRQIDSALTVIISSRSESFKNLKGETDIDPITGYKRYKSKLKPHGFETAWIIEPDNDKPFFTADFFTGKADEITNRKYEQLLTIVFAWMALTKWHWNLEETMVQNYPAWKGYISEGKHSGTHLLVYYIDELNPEFKPVRKVKLKIY